MAKKIIEETPYLLGGVIEFGFGKDNIFVYAHFHSREILSKDDYAKVYEKGEKEFEKRIKEEMDNRGGEKVINTKPKSLWKHA